MSESSASWDSVAAAWRKHFGVIESATGELNRRLIDRAGIAEGHAVLDVATGAGEPALTAARRVGRGGRVTALDFSVGMLAQARARAAEAGLENLAFLQCDAQAMAFAPASFDAAICRWGLMLIPDPRAALHGVLDALKPGARFAAAVWGPEERVPFIALPRKVAARELGGPPPPGPGLDSPPHPLRFGREGLTEDLFREAGFADVAAETVQVVFRYPSPAAYAAMVRDMSSSMRQTLEEHPAEVRERVWEGLATAAGAHRDGTGGVALASDALCVWGRRA